jgi:hypothetical protein
MAFPRRSDVARTMKNRTLPEDRAPIAPGSPIAATDPRMNAARRHRRPSRIARPAALALALACAGVPRAVRAAADDVNTPPLAAEPDAGSRVLAFGRRVIDTVLASERSVVDAIGANVAANLHGPTVRVSTGSNGIDTRSAALAARATAGANAAADPTQRSAGVADFSLGAKWHVLQGDAGSHVPCVSWMADVQPVSVAALAGGNVLRPSMHLSAEWALSEDMTLGVMPGVAMDLDPQGRRMANGTIAVTIGKEWAPGVRTFVDLARDRLALAQGGATSTTLDAGITVMTGPSTQVDFALARGLTSAAPALQAGVGVSSTF